MSDALDNEIRVLTAEVQMLRAAMAGEVVTAELATFEDPTPAKLDELISEQKRTNELLEALLRGETDSFRAALALDRLETRAS